MKTSRRTDWVLFFAFVLLLGSGQSAVAQTQDQAEKEASASNSSADGADVTESESPESTYVYTPGGRDPFESLLDIRKPVTKTTEPQTPLQKFDLQQLRLVGVITGLGSPKAMIVAPDGKSYVLGVGTKVGKNNGVVVEIDKKQVVVKESFYDFTGEVRTNLQTIELPKREGV